MHYRLLPSIFLFILIFVPFAYGFGEYPIYGIHFAGPGSPDTPLRPEETIANGKKMYSLEMLYTTDYSPASIVHIKDVVKRGFRVILRLDYSKDTFSIPKNCDFDGLKKYAAACGQIAKDLKSAVNIYVIGNELGPHVQSDYPSDWYVKVFDECYIEIHRNDPGAVVCLYGTPGGANDDYFAYWKDVVDNVKSLDGFAFHAYSGPTFWNHPTPSEPEDPRFADVMNFKCFSRFCEYVYTKYGARKPCYITETNTYWLGNPGAEITYRKNWIKEAFEAIDQWNKSNDIKIDALCWYVYYPEWMGGDQKENALWRTDNDKLNMAREDFSWVTANTNYIPGYPGSTLHFEAENFTNTAHWETDKNSVENVDYFDTTEGNLGGCYRNEPKEKVDIGCLPGGKGYYVGWTEAGEWLRYRTCAGGRNYKIRVRYANAGNKAGRIYFTINGSKVADDVVLPPTKSYVSYNDAFSRTFHLPRGVHDIKLNFVVGSVNIDFFEFIPVR